MKISIKAFLASFALTLFIAYLFVTWSQNTRPSFAESRIQFMDHLEKEGAPDLVMTDIAGQTVQISQLKGKIVVLNFWASWCTPCLEEFPSMMRLFDEFNKSVVILAVSQDNERADIDAFLKAFKGFEKAGIHIIHDKSKELGNAFEVDRLPESFIFGTDGKMVKKIVGSINWYSEDSKIYLKSLLEKN